MRQSASFLPNNPTWFLVADEKKGSARNVHPRRKIDERPDGVFTRFKEPWMFDFFLSLALSFHCKYDRSRKYHVCIIRRKFGKRIYARSREKRPIWKFTTKALFLPRPTCTTFFFQLYILISSLRQIIQSFLFCLKNLSILQTKRNQFFSIKKNQNCKILNIKIKKTNKWETNENGT